MAKMHVMLIRCDDCGDLYSVRKPHPSSQSRIPDIIASIRCPRCHPESLKDMCAACRLPLALLRPKRKYGEGTKRHPSGYHADLCFPCYQRLRRRRLALQTQPQA